nr:hypothetical protein Iba_chr04eCG8330 [Ipomoea batatas]
MLLFDLPLARLGMDDIDDVGELRRRISRVRKEERMARGRTEEWVEQPAVTKITSKRAMVTRRRCHVEQHGTGGYVRTLDERAPGKEDSNDDGRWVPMTVVRTLIS